MYQLFLNYWPHFLALFSTLAAAIAASHAALTKVDVRAAIGWVGVILLSPVLGSLLYLAAGINRIRRESLTSDRRAAEQALPPEICPIAPEHVVSERFGRRFAAQRHLGDRLTPLPLTSSNHIELLDTGDIAYHAMLTAIHHARHWILMESYIFDHDRIGLRFAEALAEAQARGVAVRVLVDAVGARYSSPGITKAFRAKNILHALFNGRHIVGLRLPYANLRTHRKVLIVDGEVAFAGGLNIREGYSENLYGPSFSHDTHFRITGPVVAELFTIAAADWTFATQERLTGDAWALPQANTRPGAPGLMRAVASGPDDSLETSHRLLMGAISVARRSIRIMSPYFLPDRELISALATAARRGVEVDIVVPGQNNLHFVERAMWAQFDQVLAPGCRVWRAQGAFNHSKLLCIDNTWSLVGSSNMDPRSLRLNFEVDLEVFDQAFAGRINARIQSAINTALPVTRESLKAQPLLRRLADRVVWLASPYL